MRVEERFMLRKKTLLGAERHNVTLENDRATKKKEAKSINTSRLTLFRKRPNERKTPE